MEHRDGWRRAGGAAWALVIASALLAACASPSPSPSASPSPPPPIPTEAPPAAAPKVPSPAASPRASASGGLASDFKDFEIVAYQGEALLGGREVRFSQVFEQGKPVVLNFWAGLCPPCRAEMPWFQKVADEFEGKVVLVGVDIGPFIGLGSHDDARQLLRELKIRYPTAYAVDASPVRQYTVRSMPTTVLFDASGKLVEKHEGLLLEAQLRSKLQKLTS